MFLALPEITMPPSFYSQYVLHVHGVHCAIERTRKLLKALEPSTTINRKGGEIK